MPVFRSSHVPALIAAVLLCLVFACWSVVRPEAWFSVTYVEAAAPSAAKGTGMTRTDEAQRGRVSREDHALEEVRRAAAVGEGSGRRKHSEEPGVDRLSAARADLDDVRGDGTSDRDWR